MTHMTRRSPTPCRPSPRARHMWYVDVPLAAVLSNQLANFALAAPRPRLLPHLHPHTSSLSIKPPTHIKHTLALDQEGSWRPRTSYRCAQATCRRARWPMRCHCGATLPRGLHRGALAAARSRRPTGHSPPRLNRYSRTFASTARPRPSGRPAARPASPHTPPHPPLRIAMPLARRSLPAAHPLDCCKCGAMRCAKISRSTAAICFDSQWIRSAKRG